MSGHTDGERASRSLPVEIDGTAAPILALRGHEIERAKAVGWEYLPAGRSNPAAASRTALFLIHSDAGRASPLSKLELAEGLLEAKQAYETKHPETKVGAMGGGKNGKGTRTKGRSTGAAKPAARFTLRASNDLGVSETKVKELVRLAEELEGEARAKFASGEISRAAALRELGPARPRSSPAQDALTKAVRALERELTRTAEVSEGHRGLLVRLVARIGKAIGHLDSAGGIPAPDMASDSREGGDGGVSVCGEDGSVRTAQRKEARP